MKKVDAIKLLSPGKPNVCYVARVLGLSRWTVSRWPEDLPQNVADQVRGAHMRVTEEKDREATAVFGGGE